MNKAKYQDKIVLIKSVANDITTIEVLDEQERQTGVFLDVATSEVEAIIIEIIEPKEDEVKLATFEGTLKAFASQTNPFQTHLELVLTDFAPNKNKQAVPKSEAESIIATAKNRPFKINFAGSKINGHLGAIPVGSLIDVYQDGEQIKAKAILWNDEFPEVDEYFRAETAKGNAIKTSWEIYHSGAELNDGVEYLRNCVFGATCAVENPAYGNRTPVLSIAETELQSLVNSLTENLYTVINALYELSENEKRVSVFDGSVEAEISAALDLLRAYLSNKVQTLSEDLEKKEAELAAEKLWNTRSETLTELGIAKVEDRKDLILSLSEEAFSMYVTDLKSATKTVTLVPEPMSTDDYSISDIAQAIVKEVKGK